MARGSVASEISTLLFSHSWEDPDSDRLALGLRSDENLFAITSGGCNVLGFLLQNPRVLHCVDINPLQSHLLELKCAAIRRLSFGDFLAFLGVTPSGERRAMFETIAVDLSEPARRYWRQRRDAVRDGVNGSGRFERFLRLFRVGLRLLQGRARIEGLLGCRSLQNQAEFHDRRWNTRRWRAIFRMVFNRWVLARMGLSGDYFEFDDGSASYSASFLGRATRAFREIPISGNYFLAQYLAGRYLDRENVPDYLREKNFTTIRERLDRLRIVTEDARSWFGRQPPASIDAFSLSNICELMSIEETANTFEAVARAARPGARICFRNLMVPRSVPDSLRGRLRLNEELSNKLLAGDRSIVYARVDAYAAAP